MTSDDPAQRRFDAMCEIMLFRMTMWIGSALRNADEFTRIVALDHLDEQRKFYELAIEAEKTGIDDES